MITRKRSKNHLFLHLFIILTIFASGAVIAVIAISPDLVFKTGLAGLSDQVSQLPASMPQAVAGADQESTADQQDIVSELPPFALSIPDDATDDTAAPVPAATPDPGGSSATPEAAPPPAQAIIQKPVTTFQTYTVRRGDYLAAIAARYNVPIVNIMRLNGLRNANQLLIGQVLRVRTIVVNVPQVVSVPRPPMGDGPSNKLVPDSEAVYSPAYENFDINAVAQKFNGYLAHYSENVEGQILTGPQIIQLVSERFSVGPRVLLTALEMQAGWVTQTAPNLRYINYPMGYFDPYRSGLYNQLFWAADTLNDGYYGQVYKYMNTLTFKDGSRIRLSPSVNPGTAGVQNLFARETTWDNWRDLIGPDGFTATYQKLFGDPFANAIEPLVPPDLKQPTLRLPWEDDHTWFFTGGPHGGYASGSAWAATDFAPTDGAGTCVPSSEYAVAAAPGHVVQAEHGRVMLNLSDGDFQGSGWVLMYMHMSSEDRVQVGMELNPGDQVGHPSCEGGAAQADHVHFARLYNGQWISAADQKAPMDLAGWVVHGSRREYDGSISRGSDSVEACNCHSRQLNGIYGEAGPVAANVIEPTSKQASGLNITAGGAAITTIIIPHVAITNGKPVFSFNQADPLIPGGVGAAAPGQ